MKLKRPIFLISGTVIGTVGVLSYVPLPATKGSLLSVPPTTQSSTTPSQVALASATPSSQNVPNNQTTPTKTTPTKSPAATVTKTATKTSTKILKKTTRKTSSQTPTQTATQTPTQTPAPTQTATATRTISGSTFQTPYGLVQVQITVQGTKIINATALQTPRGGRSSWINQQAVPYLIQETLAAQSAKIQGVGGATYTSEGWAQSLQAALAKI